MASVSLVRESLSLIQKYVAHRLLSAMRDRQGKGGNPFGSRSERLRIRKTPTVPDPPQKGDQETSCPSLSSLCGFLNLWERGAAPLRGGGGGGWGVIERESEGEGRKLLSLPLFPLFLPSLFPLFSPFKGNPHKKIASPPFTKGNREERGGWKISPFGCLEDRQ